MTSSYLDQTLLISRKRYWKRRWVEGRWRRRRRRRRNNLGIHWNSLSTAGRGVISREGFKRAISGAAPLPTHPLVYTYNRVYQNLSLPPIIHLSTPQRSTLVPIRVCGCEAWLADRWVLREGWGSQPLSLQEKMAALVGVPRFLPCAIVQCLECARAAAA